MQIWQVLPVFMLVGFGVLAYLLRGKVGARAQMYTQGMAAVSAAASAQRRPGESEPVCIMATTRSTFGAKIFFVALTDQRLLLAEAGKETRSFSRSDVSLAVQRKQWTDIGNMQTTESEGWEAKVELPGGESHVWRIYEATDPASPEGRSIIEFLRGAGAPVRAHA